jgi:hypothetical protein
VRYSCEKANYLTEYSNTHILTCGTWTYTLQLNNTTETFIFVPAFSSTGGGFVSDIREIKEDIQGIKSAFLTKNGEILEKDAEFSADVLNSISMLIYFLHYKKGELKKILITGDYHFFIFFRNSHALGVVVAPDIDVRLLNWVTKRILKDLSLPAGMSSEEVLDYFRSEYRSLQKEILKLLHEIKKLKEKNELLEQEMKTLKKVTK